MRINGANSKTRKRKKEESQQQQKQEQEEFTIIMNEGYCMMENRVKSV